MDEHTVTEKEWERLGFPISRQTMTNWALRIDKDYFQPVVSYLLKTAKEESSVLNCDESHINVNNEKTEKGNPKQCQMWVVRTGKFEKKPIVVFNYRPTRAGKESIDILKGYRKWFVADGYQAVRNRMKQETDRRKRLSVIRLELLGRKLQLWGKRMNTHGRVLQLSIYQFYTE